MANNYTTSPALQDVLDDLPEIQRPPPFKLPERSNQFHNPNFTNTISELRRTSEHAKERLAKLFTTSDPSEAHRVSIYEAMVADLENDRAIVEEELDQLRSLPREKRKFSEQEEKLISQDIEMYVRKRAEIIVEVQSFKRQ